MPVELDEGTWQRFEVWDPENDEPYDLANVTSMTVKVVLKTGAEITDRTAEVIAPSTDGLGRFLWANGDLPEGSAGIADLQVYIEEGSAKFRTLKGKLVVDDAI